MRRHFLALILIAFATASCSDPATEEDRKEVIGIWTPDDGSGHFVEFRENGEFYFLYDPGPPSTVLQVGWKLRSKGKVDILQHDGSVYRTCNYKIEAGKLSIDDGNGAECVRSATTPTTLMPLVFSKTK